MRLALVKRRATVLFAAGGALLAAACTGNRPQAVELPPPVVHVALPVQRTVSDYEVFTARTQAVQSVELKARITGYLTKILFTDGALVKEGDTLFQIDDRPYKAALNQAKGGLEVAKASLELAKASLVKTQAEYDIGLQVQKQSAGAISDQDITRRLGARDESRANIEQAKANIDRATANLENAQLNFDWCNVTAPISGRTTRHLVDVGNVVSQNTTVLVNIVSLKPIWAYVNVDQNTVQRVQNLVKGGHFQGYRNGEMPVGMSVGVGADERFLIAGIVDYVGNQLDPNTGTVQARSVYPNKDETIVAGMFARIRVPVSAPHSALLVTDMAVGTNQSQKYVLIVNDKDEVETRMVDVGQVHDGLREIMRTRAVLKNDADGKEVTTQVEVFKPTDRVIVDGLQRVRPGAKVKPELVNMQTMLPESNGDKKPSATAADKQ
jgi:RND family efflux transporter MFP subunit